MKSPMHELSVAQAIAEIACRHAVGRRVSRIELKVGSLRQVVPTSLRFSFELVAQGTLAEGAELAMQTVPATATCRACRTETVLEQFPFQCSSCGGYDLDIVAGNELEVESIECLEESDDVPRPSQNLGG